MEKKIIYSLFFIVVIWGAFLRFYYIDEESLWIDEGFTIMQSKAIGEHGYPMLPSGKTDFKDILLPYLLALPGIIFGDNVPLFRSISAIFGVFSIVLAFFIGKKIANQKMGLLFSFFISFSYWHVAWSRQIRSYSLVVFLILIALYFLIGYHKKKKKRNIFSVFSYFDYQRNKLAEKYLYWALLGILLASLSKIFAFLLLPPVVIFIFLKEDRKIARITLLFLFIISLSGWFWASKVFNFTLNNYAGFYFFGYFWKSYQLIFLLFLTGIPIAMKYDFENKKLHWFNFVSFVSIFIFYSFFVYVNQSRYLFPLSVFFYLYATYTIYYFSYYFVDRKMVYWLTIILVVTIDIFTAQSFQFRPRTDYPLEYFTPQPEFRKAYNFLESNMNNDAVIISAYPFMDQICLGKSNYALAISYTGSSRDLSVTEDRKEYYSGTPEILSTGEMINLQKKQDLYFLFDRMALSRVNSELVGFIQEYGKSVFSSSEKNVSKSVFVYEIKKESLNWLDESEKSSSGEIIDVTEGEPLNIDQLKTEDGSSATGESVKETASDEQPEIEISD